MNVFHDKFGRMQEERIIRTRMYLAYLISPHLLAAIKETITQDPQYSNVKARTLTKSAKLRNIKLTNGKR